MSPKLKHYYTIPRQDAHCLKSIQKWRKVLFQKLLFLYEIYFNVITKDPKSVILAK